MNSATAVSLSMGFDLASSTSSSSTASSLPSGGDDHLQRLAAMAQGVGKEDPDQAAPADPTLTYPVSYPYGPWPYGPCQYPVTFSQTLGPAAFPAWPQQYASPHWQYGSSKKGRQTYQRYQTSVLEAKFQQSSYVSKKQREELRLQTNLTDRQIKIWFQNRRMKAKKEKHRMEDHGEHSALLPANPPPGKVSMDDDEKKWNVPVPSWPHQQPHPYHVSYPPGLQDHPGLARTVSLCPQ